MADNYFKVKKGLQVQPSSAPATEQGDIRVDASTGKLKAHDGSAEQTVASEAHVASQVDPLDSRLDDVEADIVALEDADAALDGRLDTAEAHIASIQASRGAPSGLATLGVDSKIPSAQLPALAITDTFVAGSQAAMLALSAAETGDVCVRTDLSKSFILQGTNPATLSHWQELLTPTDAVQSVNGKVGSVNLTAADVGAITAAGADTLTNKTLGDALTFTEIATPAGLPGSGKRYLYAKSDGKLYHKGNDGVETPVGTGSGGSVNYLPNGNAEDATGGPVAYANGSATPTTGTGGSPTATIAKTATNPLSGKSSWLYTPGALGNGFSWDFPVERKDRASVQTIELAYEIGGTGYADGALELWVLPLDGSDTSLIQASPHKLLNVIGPAKHVAKFQTTADATQYRLICHQTTATATYTVKFEASVGAQVAANGDGVIAARAHKSAAQNVNSGSITKVALDGVTYNDSGLFSVANNRFTATLPGIYSVKGLVTFPVNSTGGRVAYIYKNGSVHTTSVVTAGSGDKTGVQVADSIKLNVGDYLELHCFQSSGGALALNTGADYTYMTVERISAPVTASDAGDGRVVAATCYQTTGTSCASGVEQIINFDSVQFDTHGCIQPGANWKYVVSVPGVYQVSAQTLFNFLDTSVQNLAVYKNGVITKYIAYMDDGNAAGQVCVLTGSILLNLKAGDYIDVRVSQSSGSARTTQPGFTVFNIQRLSGSAAVMPGETVAAKFNTCNISFPIGSSTTVAVFGTKEFDTHGAYNASTGVFTCPSPGKYRVTSYLQSSAAVTATTIGATPTIRLRRGGSQVSTIASYQFQTTAAAMTLFFSGSTEIECLAQDTLDVVVSNPSGVPAWSGAGSSIASWVLIEKVGN